MHYAIGIDIGATRIKGVIAADNGKILLGRKVETKIGRIQKKILGDIIELIKYLGKKAGFKKFKIEGVGVGVPGVIKRGKLVFGGGTLKKFTGLALENIIEKETRLKVFLQNDALCFTLAESYFGAGKKCNRVAGVIWGTGIGSGIADKRKKQRLPLEMGHFVVESDIKTEPKDACGQRGCVENMASGKNIIRRYYARGGKIKNAGVREIYFFKEKVAKEVLEDAYKYLGMGIFSLVRLKKPEIVVIGGGVSNLPKPAHDKVKKHAFCCLPKKIKKPKIVKSKLGEYAGALGAAMLCLKR